MRERITSMGEMLIDFLPIIEGDRTTGFRMFAGGSVLNVAVGVARLDAPSNFSGKVSSDYFGRFLRDYTHKEGVDTRFLLDDPAPSTLAFVAMEHGEAAYAFYGDQAADTRLSFVEVPQALLAETAIFHTGSISLLRGQTPEAILSTYKQLKGQALLSFDPNIRPGLVHDEVAYRKLLDTMFGLADLVKLSTVDTEWLFPSMTPAAAAANIRAKGPAVVVITRGGEGVLAVYGPHPNDIVEVPSFPIKLADTVGAGDSFTGGILSSLHKRGVYSREKLEALPVEELSAVLRFAAAVAAITCTRSGANPPRTIEVEEFLENKA